MYSRISYAVTKGIEPIIGEAVVSTGKTHRGISRRGTGVPYIIHPLEIVAIISAFTDGEEVTAAALLRDIMEDAGVTKGELEEAFGARVACLVMNESGDRRKTWQEREGYTV